MSQCARGPQAAALLASNGRRLDETPGSCGAAGPNVPAALGGNRQGSATMSREAILAKVRAGLGVTRNGNGAGDAERRAAARQYIAERERHLVPERALKSRPQLLEQFTALLMGQSATVHTLEGPDQVPAA